MKIVVPDYIEVPTLYRPESMLSLSESIINYKISVGFYQGKTILITFFNCIIDNGVIHRLLKKKTGFRTAMRVDRFQEMIVPNNIMICPYCV